MYTLTVRNETSDLLDVIIFHKPTETPSLSERAWRNLRMSPNSPMTQVPIPVEFENHDFYISVRENESSHTPQMRIQPGHGCKICGSKEQGYTIETN